MTLLSRFQTIDEADKTRAVTKLVENATPDFDFFFMVVLSVLMATFGLIAGSETVVIGSMLLAPIMNPILGLSLGLAMSSHRLIRRSLHTMMEAALWAMGASMVVTIMFSFGAGAGDIMQNAIIMSRTQPSLIYFMVALLAGLAVAYTMVKPHLSETLPGVAVSVALMPPLAVVGIGLVHLNIVVITGALMMFLLNVAGIIFAAMLSFSLMDVHHKRFIASRTIEKESKRVQKEDEEVKKIAQENDIEDAVMRDKTDDSE